MSSMFYCYQQQPRNNGRYNSHLPRIVIVKAQTEASAFRKAKLHAGIDLEEKLTQTMWYGERAQYPLWSAQDWYNEETDEFSYRSPVPRFDDYIIGQGKIPDLDRSLRGRSYMVIYDRDCIVEGKLA